jgi:phosphate-selective porin OprO/OprP
LNESRNLSTWFLDAIYKHKGFSAMAEYANRQTDETAAVEADSTGTVTQAFYTGKALNGQAAYLFKNNFEIGARYTTLIQDPDTQREDIKHYTIGVSKYIVGHSLKAQSDITLIDRTNTPDLWMFRFQIEFAF